MAHAAETVLTVPERLARPAARPVDSRRLARNYLWLSSGEALAKVLTFAAFTYMGRVLGPARYGNLEFVLAVMVFFTLPVDLGLGYYGAREVARNKKQAISLLQDITALRLLLALGSFAVLLIFTLAISKNPHIKVLLLLYGLSLFACPALLQWFFQGYDRMNWVSVVSIVRHFVFTALVLLLLRPHTSLDSVGFYECASAIAAGAVCLYIVRVRLRLDLPPLRFRLNRFLPHLREAVPIGLSELTWAFLTYFATVILGLMAPGRSLGWFGASHRVVMALHTFVWLYFFNLLPSITRCASEPKQHLLGLMRRSMTIGVWSGVFVAVVFTLLSQQLVTIAYGPAFSGAAHSLSVLVWILPVTLLSGHYRYALIGFNQQKWLLYSTAMSAAVCIVLCFSLIPRFGATGAAAALLIAFVVNFVLVYLCVRKFIVDIPFVSRLAKPLLALAASLVAFYSLAPLTIWPASIAAALVYLVILWAWERRQFLLLSTLVLRKSPSETTAEL